MKHRNIFWGGLLVTLGALFILKNTDVIYFNWHNIFGLWPMILILIGVTVLPIKDFLKTVLTILVLGITVTLLLTNSSRWYGPLTIKWHNIDTWSDKYDDYDNSATYTDQHFYEPYNSEITEATLNIDAAVGDFKIMNESLHLLDFTRDGNVGLYVYSSSINDEHQRLKLDIKKKFFKRKNLINDVEIKLHPNPVWNLIINSGAAEINLDLRNFKTKNIEIDGGATAIYLRLGDKYNKMNIDLDSGVSSIEIFIPEESGCKINTDTFLSSKSFDNFQKIKRGLYQTEKFEDAKNKIYINIDAAITSLSVVRY
jgi:hypothetical protein